MKKLVIKKVFVLLSVLMMVTCMVGCGDDNKLLQGSWEVTEATYRDLDGKISTLQKSGLLQVQKNTTFVFQDDLTVSSQGSSMIWSYKYKDGFLELETAGAVQGYSCECTGNRITLTTFTQQAVGDSGGTDLVTIVLQKI